MDSFEMNKVLGGLLGTAFVVFSISLVSDAIFASPVPEKPGFTIEAAEEAGAGAGGGEAAAAAVPIAQLLASANAEAGAAVFKKCTACHSIEKGGPNKVGPDLWGVVNRPMASHEGFAYSGGMKEFSQGSTVVWDFEHLNHFLTSPKAYIKGTAMGFAGIKKDDERANLIAYLNSQSDSPAPLPTPGAAPAATPAAAPAEGAAPAPAGAAPAPAEGAAPAAPANGEAKPAEGAAPATSH